MKRFIFQKWVFFFFVAAFCLTSPILTVQAESWSWTKVADNANLQSIDMASSTDGWAVGSEGTIIHWDGTRWNNIDSPTTANLRAADVISINEVYAVASVAAFSINESLIRWDGASWKNVTTPMSYLRSVDMISSTDGWAVGYGGLIIRWNGINWTKIDSPTNTPLESISAVNATDAWAVGSNKYNSGIFHWNGTGWSIFESPSIVGTRTLWSVDMLSSSDGWAVGDSGIIIRWDGVNWKNFTSPIPENKHLFSVNMVNSNDGWAVGSDGTIIHWNGTEWSNVASPTGAWLSCVDMVNSGDGWIVGADGIYRWQEAAGFPIEYLTIFAAVVVVAFVALILIKFYKKGVRKEISANPKNPASDTPSLIAP
jgi:photosystem II stability/assembly factor-like uncharacterized protein